MKSTALPMPTDSSVISDEIATTWEALTAALAASRAQYAPTTARAIAWADRDFPAAAYAFLTDDEREQAYRDAGPAAASARVFGADSVADLRAYVLAPRVRFVPPTPDPDPALVLPRRDVPYVAPAYVAPAGDFTHLPNRSVGTDRDIVAAYLADVMRGGYASKADHRRRARKVARSIVRVSVALPDGTSVSWIRVPYVARATYPAGAILSRVDRVGKDGKRVRYADMMMSADMFAAWSASSVVRARVADAARKAKARATETKEQREERLRKDREAKATARAKAKATAATMAYRARMAAHVRLLPEG